MVLGSIIDEQNGNTVAGSGLIPPAPLPNCDVLNMENDDAAEMLPEEVML